jgi:membrane associated rhomboid family serine protease
MNVFAQLRFGISKEREWGLFRFVIVYFTTGVGGSLMSCLLRPDGVGVGASSAIMGILGCYTIQILFTWSEAKNSKSQIIQGTIFKFG